MTEMEFVQLYFLKAVRFAVHGAIIRKHKNGNLSKALQDEIINRTEQSFN